MRMQRVEFSIRQFLSLLLFLPATDGKVHLQAFHHFSFLLSTKPADNVDCCSCLDYSPSLSSATGAAFRHQRANSPRLGGEGGRS